MWESLKWIIFGDPKASRRFVNRFYDTEANKIAARLLWKYLTYSQRKSFEKEGSFEVIGYSGAVYRINKYAKASLGNGAVNLCGVPYRFMPDPDRILQIVIAIQTEEGEKAYLEKAIATIPGRDYYDAGFAGFVVDPVNLTVKSFGNRLIVFNR